MKKIIVLKSLMFYTINKMKILVVYYSRTGTTAKIAKELSREFKCDIEEVHDRKNRKGILGWIIAGGDGTSKKTTVIEKTVYNPSLYDLVIIGTPKWVNTTPAIRTYLKENVNKFKKVAFFCTMDSSSGKNVLEEMAQITGEKPIAVMELRSSDVKKENYRHTLQEFVSKIK